MARLGIFLSLFGLVSLQLCALATETAEHLNVDKTPQQPPEDDLDDASEDVKDDLSSSLWQTYFQNFGPPRDNSYGGHFIRKRFADDLDGYGYGYPGSDGMDDYMGYGGYMSDDESPVVADKRQASRWKYIYRKLYDLDRNSKRSPLRWKLIYNKLNELDNGASKRGAGRWKNMSWMLNRGDRPQQPYAHSLQKRFIGRWKNNNWLLQQHRNQHL